MKSEWLIIEFLLKTRCLLIRNWWWRCLRWWIDFHWRSWKWKRGPMWAQFVDFIPSCVQILSTFYQLHFSSHAVIRKAAYAFIGGRMEFWTLSSLEHRSLAILLSSLGEQDSDARSILIEELLNHKAVPFVTLHPLITQFKVVVQWVQIYYIFCVDIVPWRFAPIKSCKLYTAGALVVWAIDRGAEKSRGGGYLVEIFSIFGARNTNCTTRPVPVAACVCSRSAMDLNILYKDWRAGWSLVWWADNSDFSVLPWVTMNARWHQVRRRVNADSTVPTYTSSFLFSVSVCIRSAGWWRVFLCEWRIS